MGNKSILSGLDNSKIYSGILIWLSLAAFVWLMLYSISVIGSGIILLNRGGYQQSNFTVEKITYWNNSEMGLYWVLTAE